MYTKLEYKQWSLSLDLEGGRIRSLSHASVPIIGTYARIDGKAGSTHLCAPSFDKEGQEAYLLPFHGYARTLAWQLVSLTQNSITISATTPQSDSYPARLQIDQTFILSDIFHHEIQVTNVQGEEVPLNVGIHYYWDTPRGWDGTQINGVDATNGIRTNGYAQLVKKNTLRFPHATYELSSNGFHDAVLWTSFISDERGEKQFSQDFCCIEPVVAWPNYFGTPSSIIKPRQTVSFSVEIGKVV